MVKIDLNAFFFFAFLNLETNMEFPPWEKKNQSLFISLQKKDQSHKLITVCICFDESRRKI